MATRTDTTPTSARADTRLLMAIAAAGATIIAFPIAFAAYANSRPMSEAMCETTRELMFSGSMADVTTCRVLVIEVRRSSAQVGGQ